MIRQLFIAATLMCALCLTVTAGEIPTSDAPKPSQQETAATINPGHIPTDGMAQSISDAALSALMTALGLAAI
jgi:hypothetical protein